jgi:hypothetical protein
VLSLQIFLREGRESSVFFNEILHVDVEHLSVHGSLRVLQANFLRMNFIQVLFGVIFELVF